MVEKAILTLDEKDVLKLNILKKRFGYSKNIELIRYLLTVEVEKMMIMIESEHEHDKLKDNQKEKINDVNVGAVAAAAAECIMAYT